MLIFEHFFKQSPNNIYNLIVKKCFTHIHTQFNTNFSPRLVTFCAADDASAAAARAHAHALDASVRLLRDVRVPLPPSPHCANIQRARFLLLLLSIISMYLSNSYIYVRMYILTVTRADYSAPSSSSLLLVVNTPDSCARPQFYYVVEELFTPRLMLV